MEYTLNKNIMKLKPEFDYRICKKNIQSDLRTLG